MHILLLFSVGIIATCGLIYELAAGTLASYLLGDSVTQFSTIIGVYLFSMGIGSFLSRYVRSYVLDVFVQVEIIVGIIGGISSALLFVLFPHIESFRVVLYAIVTLTGIFVGLEIPLLMNILRQHIEFRDMVSRVFSYDYAGALLASVIFPLLMVPYLGLVRTSFAFGSLNVAVALLLSIVLAKELHFARTLQGQSAVVLVLLLAGIYFSENIVTQAEQNIYGENIIYSTSSPYQRIVLTRHRKAIKLYLNNNLQFSSADEYRYHEALVHPAMCLHSTPPRKIAVLGGGDGLAVREILKYPFVEQVTLVDLDPAITTLFSQNGFLTQINNHSLQSPKVQIVNTDAFVWLRKEEQKYDVVIIDFPDPSTYSVGKLYTDTFYRMLQNILHDSSIVVVQSTSPFVAPVSYWCVNTTIRSVGFFTIPYHVFIPSFGDWGYILASQQKEMLIHSERVPDSLRFFSADTFENMKCFPLDMSRSVADVNRLNNQILVQHFDREWSEVLH